MGPLSEDRGGVMAELLWLACVPESVAGGYSRSLRDAEQHRAVETAFVEQDAPPYGLLSVCVVSVCVVVFFLS